MNVKSLKKQLVAAIAMVVVAAVALSSSTFAWFASNNSVKAENISVTAQSDAKFLEITTLGTDFTGSTIATNALTAGSTTPTDGLYPVTPFKLTATDKTGTVGTDLAVNSGNITWSYTYSDTVNTSTKGTEQVWKTVGASGNHTLAQSVVSNDFYFRMTVEGVTGTNLKAIAADFGTITAAIDNGVTVLLAGANGYQVITSNGTITSYNNTGAVDGNAALVSNVGYVDAAAEDTASKVTVYVFYDGENTNVTTEKLASIVGVTVASITFAVD